MAIWDLRVIEAAFADAAVDPIYWARALNIVTEQTGAFGAFLAPSLGGHLPNLPISERMDESFDAYLRGGWYLRDERYRGFEVMNKAGVCDDLDFIDADAMKKHPYYQEFLAPLGLRWFGGVRMGCGEDMWCLSIQRRIDQVPFSPEEKRKLSYLSNSLSTAASMSRALGFAAGHAALEAFDISGTAVVLLDRRGSVIRINQAADKLLTGDVRISGNALVASDVAANAMLHARIHALLWSRSGAALAPPVALPRSGERPLLAHVLKLSAISANALADCQAAIVFVDLGLRLRPQEALLQIAYGLTDAEARLAARISSGQNLGDIARQLHITKETSRSQLKAIFAKTGVHRQAELVSLLAANSKIGGQQ